MKKKKKPTTKYKKVDPFEELFPLKPWDQSLYKYVLNTFPDTNPKMLRNWQKNIKESSIDPEPILFIAMVCGTYFRISHPDVKKALEDLWKWLRQGPSNQMSPDLAELLIEVLEPGIRKVIEERGYQRGWPNGPQIRKKGRPPSTRGIWVVAFIVREYLQEKIKDFTAKDQAINLASILLGREIELSEFYRIHKKTSKTSITNLTKRLLGEYNFWLNEDGIRFNDPPPSQNQGEQYRKWYANHKALPNMVISFGCEGICKQTLSRIPTTLLEPFWDIKNK